MIDSDQVTLENAIFILGCVFALQLTYGVLIELKNGLCGYLLPRLWRLAFGLPKDFKTRYGEWAVVTGSSQGIGRSYALELASRGLNIALVARNKERLNTVAAEIRERFAVETAVIVVDFTDSKAVKTVVKELEKMNIDIGVLVNNVGMMGPHFIPFLELEEKTARDMITVNCVSATMMCHALLPGMVERDRGAVINIVSSTSFYVMPYFSEYSATKHYMAAFTAGLRAEVGSSSNVVIQEIDPGQTNTNMARDLIPISRIEAPTPEMFVASSILSLGWSQKTGGWWFHSLHRLVSSMLPEPILCPVLHLFGWWQYRYSSKKNKSQ